MVIVSLCLLPVFATGHRFTARERAVSTGVLHLTRVVVATLAACTSIVLTTMSVCTSATTGRVCGLSQNSSVVLPPFGFTRMEQKRNVLKF